VTASAGAQAGPIQWMWMQLAAPPLLSLSRTALGLGSIAIGVWGFAAPRQLALFMGDDPELARPLALRDAILGVALLGSSGRGPLVARSIADLSDAVRLRRRSPVVAAAALAFGLLSAVVALGTPDQREYRWTQ
jgi:hypothetical protein